jgi:hypothetical protein
VRRSFDSLLGQFFDPVTNRFQLTMVTNNLAIVQTFDRVVTQPDILFSADDLAGPPTGPPLTVSYAARSIIYNTNNKLVGLPGPGLIEPSTSIIFEKIGPAFFHTLGPAFVSEEDGFPSFVWGSFDGSTNAPIVYPNGTSIVDYENEVLMQVTTTSLPGGMLSPPTLYTAQLLGSGGQTPYSWSLAPGSAGLPPGLSLSSGGTISGLPTTAGVFGFTVRLTDAGARSVTGDLSITISP